MRKAQRDLLEELTNANGTSGYEPGIANIVARQLEGAGEISYDNLGSIICQKTGKAGGPKIMLAGHMDEIGFMVKLITKEGFIKFTPLGGWWSQVLLAQRVIVETYKGRFVGIIGSKPPHLLSQEQRNKPVEMQEMFIDVGAKDKDEAENLMGIRPGDPIYAEMKFSVMGNQRHLLAKAWDDRVGVAVMIETLKGLQGVSHPNVVYGVGTVQEEVGTRGAQTAVHTVDPDIGIILEAGIAGDVPGMTEEESDVKLGAGVVIEMLDGSMVPQLRLRDFVIDTCKAENIPYQFGFIERGGTDAGRIHLHASGVPSIVICVATRYIHSHAGIIHTDDYLGALKLVSSLCKRLDAKTVAKLLEK